MTLTRNPRSLRLALISLGRSSNLNPPLGLVAIGSYLQQELPQIKVSIIDQNFTNPESEALGGEFDIIGISAMTVDYDEAITLAKRIKKRRPVPILLGGVHITTLPDSLDPLFDVAVLGEGELTLTEWLRAFVEHDHKTPPAAAMRKIDGLAFYDEKQLVTTKSRAPMSLDSSPLSDWTLLDARYFQKHRFDEVGRIARGASLMTARGCPYYCAFCSTAAFWGSSVRTYSLDHVIEEIRRLVDSYAITHLAIWDDLFTLSKKRLREFITKLEEAKLLGKLTFSCDSRANLFDEETCIALKKMGVEAVFFGLESGSDKILRFLKQPTVTVQENREAIERGVRHGFKIQGSVIFASPDETIEDMGETIDFIEFAAKKGAYRVNANTLVPFPGTEVWEIAKKRGIVSKEMDWNRFCVSHQDAAKPMLLDPDIENGVFLSVFDSPKMRRLKLLFTWRIAKAYLRNNPLELILYCAKQLLHSLVGKRK